MKRKYLSQLGYTITLRRYESFKTTFIISCELFVPVASSCWPITVQLADHSPWSKSTRRVKFRYSYTAITLTSQFHLHTLLGGVVPEFVFTPNDVLPAEETNLCGSGLRPLSRTSLAILKGKDFNPSECLFLKPFLVIQ